MSNPRLGVALVGCGRVAPNHAMAMADHGHDLRLIATCDIKQDKAEAIRNRYLQELSKRSPEITPEPVHVVQDYRCLLDNPAVDIVAIATDSGSHASIAIDALEAGKHVLVEKPMALDTRDARRMKAIAEARNLRLGLCHQNRFNPPVQLLRSKLEAGEMGRLLYGTINVRWSRDNSYYSSDDWRGTYAYDGGCLMNQSIHGIDLLLWMLGEPVRVYAETDTFLRSIEAEDTAAAVVRFRNGAMGIIEGTTCIYPTNLEETLNIFGSTGTCCLGGVAINKVETLITAQSDSDSEVDGASQKVESVYGKGHSPLYKDFADAVRTGRQPYIDAEAGLRAVEMVLAIYRSAALGEPVSFPLGDYSTLEAKEDYLRRRQ